MAKNNVKLELEYEYGLQAYFFERLKEINKKNYTPVPEENIYYSSLVMDKFGQSENFFHIEEGRVKEKVLGTTLLEAMRSKGSKQRKLLKDVGDTSLFLCGYFSESLNKKIVDIKYYMDIGQNAYQKLDHLVPSVYDIPSFFKSISNTFETLSAMMTIMHKESLGEIQENYPTVYILDNKKTG